jgi:hypothetical protein
VLTALERADTLRYLGKTEYEKRPHEVIDYVSHDNLRLALYIDEATGQLSKYETVITNSLFGRFSFGDSFPWANARLATSLSRPRRVSVLNGDVAERLSLRGRCIQHRAASRNFQSGRKAFARSRFPRRRRSQSTPRTSTQTNAGGYNVLFVDFKDYIFVMETPGNERTSLQAFEQIRKTIPNKPIKYVAVTHHHDDHAGGIRTYMAEGATLIVAPGEQAFFRKVSEARFKADPDALTRKPARTDLRTTAKR